MSYEIGSVYFVCGEVADIETVEFWRHLIASGDEGGARTAYSIVGRAGPYSELGSRGKWCLAPNLHGLTNKLSNDYAC